MTKVPNTQSQKRFEESIGHLFGRSSADVSRNFLFLKSSSDEGVIRNGGRNGARLAPQSLLATFKKLNQTQALKDTSFSELEVSEREDEKTNFILAQKYETNRILSAIKSAPKSWLCQIGGGHDHIYPLLKALSAQHKKIIVINLDAHADTRTDDAPSSGTPFRQFANEHKGTFLLYQIGLHPFANSFTTLAPLEKEEMKVLWKNEIDTKLDDFFRDIKSKIDADACVVFSLDADALSAGIVPGVSAVNADGLSLMDLTKIWDAYIQLHFKHAPIVGIYELNPVYDTLASLSMRSLSSFLFQTLK